MTQRVTIDIKKRGRWSRLHQACISCGTTHMKHISKGLCQSCYFRTYRDVVKFRAKKSNGEKTVKIQCDKTEWAFLLSLLQNGPFNTTEVFSDADFEIDVWNTQNGEKKLRIEGAFTDCVKDNGENT